MRLFFTSEAKADIRDLAAYITQDNPGAAIRAVSRIRKAAGLLADTPSIGRIGSLDGTREWVVRGLPYVLVYETDQDEGIVVILNVIHAARRRD